MIVPVLNMDMCLSVCLSVGHTLVLCHSHSIIPCAKIKKKR